jgi:hypothetical protein
VSRKQIYLMAAVVLGAANVAAATASPTVEALPWGSCYMDVGGGNCSCEESVIEPDCAGLSYCIAQYPHFCGHN